MNHYHASTVEQLLNELSLEARFALPEPERTHVENAVVRHRDWWHAGFDHADHHHQTLLAVNETIHDILADPQGGITIAMARSEALEHVFPVDFGASLRDVVVRHLLPVEVSLITLGECVDQGIRPADVAAWSYDPTIQPIEAQNTTPGQRELPWLVANRGREPGELPPDRRWPARVRALWREAGIPGELPANILPEVDRLDQASLPRYVEAVNAAIGHILSTQGIARPPTPEAPLRVFVDWESHTVTVDGHVVSRVDNPAALRIFERIALDQGELVTATDLKRLPGCKGRIDRIIRNGLPEELRTLIRSRVGAAGGYWLHLPPLSP
jgi:hypothetical protein